MKNAQYVTADVKKRCEDKLEIQFRDGKEFNGWFIHKNIKIARITVPMGKKPLRMKTYKSMAKQLKLTISQFDSLLDCPLKYDGYIELLKQQNLI